MQAQIHKVIVPVDFSDVSRHAVEYALTVFQHQLTHLYLLHAFKDNPPGSAPLISLMDILRTKSERMLQEEVEFVRSLEASKGIEVVAIARFDGLLSALHDISKAENIDLILIGSNGHTHPRVEIRDDDPAFLLHRLNRPLMLVPQMHPPVN
jgi:nucleotide-binding universal stress UspA family protein